MNPDFRQRTHALKRIELANAAFDLIVARGYNNVTADDLAAAAGVSRATFFRLLGSKDDAVIATVVEPEMLYAEALRGAGPDLPPWQALRIALEPAVARAEGSPERMRARIRLIQSEPALSSRLRRQRLPQVRGIETALLDRGLDAFSARIMSSVAVSALDQCWVLWSEAEGASLRTLLDDAFVLLGGNRWS